MAEEVHTFRVMVAEDHAQVRAGIIRELSRAPDIKVVGEAADGNALLALLRGTPCDLLVLDLSMPESGGLDVLEAIGSVAPSVRILVYSLHDEPEYFLETLSRGVSGYVLKSEDISVLVEAAHSILRGRPFYSPELQKFMQENYSVLHGRTRLQLLDEREHRVLALLAAGEKRSKIAQDLDLTDLALERLISGIVGKVGLRSDRALVEFAREMDSKAKANALPGVSSGHAFGPAVRPAAAHIHARR